MLSLLLNLVIPTIIMTQLSDEDRLGPERALILALAFPIVFGVYSMVQERRIGWMPIVGVVSLLITGGISLLRFPPEWIAVKEAAIPLALALAILVSAWIGKPLARVFLDQVLDRPKIQLALAEHGNEDEYERRTSVATYLLAGAFLLSAVLNFVLARIVVTSDSGTSAYVDELGRLNALSIPVITVPVMIVLTITIFYIMNTVSKLTGLEPETVIRQPEKKQKRGRKRDDAPATRETATTNER